MTDTPPPIVSTRQLVVGYSGKAVATIPDLDLVGGRIWHVLGPNGSGKTALLKTLADLLPSIAGRVERRCRRGRQGAIYVHSVPYLFAGSVKRNLLLVHPRQEQLRDIVAAFGLTELLERDAAELSNGQQRRLALARALAGDPSLLLVDEPEGGLDDEAVSAWRAYLVRAVEAVEPVVVMATHRPMACSSLPVTEVHLK